MPEYLYPGVYVEEIDTGNKPIEGVSTSTVGFLGIAERGPVEPTLITSFDEFRRAFGTYVREDDGTDRYLAYSVEGFFQNGGKRCFVQRVFHNDPDTPDNSAKRAVKAFGGMTVWAIGPGKSGNSIAVFINNAGLDPTDATKDSTKLFKLTVAYWHDGKPADPVIDPNTHTFRVAPSQIEVFDNISAVSRATTFYEGEINDVSDLIVVRQAADGRPDNNPNADTSPPGDPIFLENGSDGSPDAVRLSETD